MLTMNQINSTESKQTDNKTEWKVYAAKDGYLVSTGTLTDGTLWYAFGEAYAAEAAARTLNTGASFDSVADAIDAIYASDL